MRIDTDTTILPLEQKLTERVGWVIKVRWYAAVGVFVATLAGKTVLGFALPVLA